MKRLLLCTAAVLALGVPARAGIITSFGTDPTSSAGAFNHSPAVGAFDDQYTFTLAGGPAFLTIASVTNTFAQPSDFIAGFTGAVFFDGPDGVPGGGDDVAVIGPVSASPCALVPNCQALAGSTVIDTAGNYYLDISGTAGSTAGYGGNLSVSQVGAPGPVLASGLPGLILLGLAGCLWVARRGSLSVLPD